MVHTPSNHIVVTKRISKHRSGLPPKTANNDTPVFENDYCARSILPVIYSMIVGRDGVVYRDVMRLLHATT